MIQISKNVNMQIHPAYIQHIEFNRKCMRLITLQISLSRPHTEPTPP
jgi:hypothetical protein